MKGSLLRLSPLCVPFLQTRGVKDGFVPVSLPACRRSGRWGLPRRFFCHPLTLLLAPPVLALYLRGQVGRAPVRLREVDHPLDVAFRELPGVVVRRDVPDVEEALDQPPLRRGEDAGGPEP